MRIPDSIDVVILREENLDVLSERMGVSKADLRARLARDREEGVSSRYAFFLYNKPVSAH